ncbi:hypothetical protein JDV02_008340 [Purpureocillium takamizusanense]|uniref:Uncharacterized protein n=1 Tax=Purpureocillium takamizusanense TaxID=2060973 RepID=A0A9Q8QNL5_9HYPO|nr:uncharacterized protein JDV02_008340 [Purpureocillium takamizusanense]UNI22451.1 hypothetical protein JDV02_008340 [Purpureocillium takamizusanense]
MNVSVASATTQAVFLSGLSSVVAQAISAYKSKSFGEVDIVAFTHVLVYTALTTPPNHKWQQFLESAFPTQTPINHGPKSSAAAQSPGKWAAAGRSEQHRDPQPDDGPTGLNVANTVAKFFLDQTFGAVVNTILFICLMEYMKTNSFASARSNLGQNFLPMLLSGYKLWPFVCLLNLTVVPFEYRVLVGSAVGLAWGVYINLMYV